MLITRAVGALFLVVASAVAVLAQPAPGANLKPTEAQTRELEAIRQVLTTVAAGQPAPNALSMAYAGEHVLLKAQGNRQYIPFTVTIDRSAVTGNSVTVYWRAVAKAVAAPAAPAAAPAAAGAPAPAPPPAPAFAYEDMNTATLPASATGPVRLSRSVSLGAGSYDLIVVVKEPTSTQKNAVAPKVSVLQHDLEVPDFWNNELNTSSVLVLERVEPLAAPLTPQQQIDRPYALGQMEIVPAADLEFSRQSDLGWFMVIYNAKPDGANKPDVSVEYSFYVTQDGAEKFYNKMAAEEFNARTLPPQFDASVGQTLESGHQIPLGSFPPGTYRLEVKVTDKIAGASLTRNVNFTVTGS